jgi:hypothetical protein
MRYFSSRRYNILKIFNKVRDLIIVALIILSMFSIVNYLIKVETDAQSDKFRNTEATIAIQLKNNVTLDNLIKNLSTNNKFAVVNLIGGIDINNHQFPVSLNGEFTIKQVKSEFSKQAYQFLNNLKKIKNKNIKNIISKANLFPDKNTLNNLELILNKIDINQIDQAGWSLFWQGSKVYSLTLVGSLTELNKIKSRLVDISEHSSIITQIEIEKIQQKLIKTLGDGKDQKLNEKRDLSEIVSTKVQKDQPFEDRELSQEVVDKVNNVLKTDLYGKKSFNNEDLDKLDISIEDKSTTKILINQYNEVPEFAKNNIVSLLKDFDTGSNLIEKVGNVFDGIEVEANSTENLIDRLWRDAGSILSFSASWDKVSLWAANWVIGGLSFAVGNQRERLFIPLYRFLINTCYIFWSVLATCLAINAVLASAIIWSFAGWLANFVRCWGGVRINMNKYFNTWIDCL